MSTRVTRLAAPNAKVRALAAELLSREEKRSLIVAATFDDAVHQLTGTVYRRYLGEGVAGLSNLFLLEKALQRGLVDAYERLLWALAGGLYALVLEMLRRFEVDNLQVILRGLATAVPDEEIRSLLVPLGRYERLPIAALLAAPAIGDAVAALDGLPYAGVLRNALDRYRREGTLFVIEVALDLDYYRRLWSTMGALPGRDRIEAAELLGMRYDVINVEWMLRYKALYHLSPEEIFNYTLPAGYRVRDDTVRRVADAADLREAIAALPEPYRSLLLPLAGEEAPWRLEVALRHWLWGTARRAMGGYPFRVGAILGFLALKEAEVHDIRAILEGKQSGRGPEEIETFLWGEA